MAQIRSVNTVRTSAYRTGTYGGNVYRTSTNTTNINITNINRTNARRTVSGRNADREANDMYVYGNTVRRLSPQRQWENEPRKQLSHETRKNRDKARHMSLGYVAFLIVAFCTCAFILINYIQLQAELTNRTKGLAYLESELNTLRQENDEEYNRITSSIDLEEIKQVAIGELGMTYAEEWQIISYDSVQNDYMRQVKEDPK